VEGLNAEGAAEVAVRTKDSNIRYVAVSRVIDDLGWREGMSLDRAMYKPHVSEVLANAASGSEGEHVKADAVALLKKLNANLREELGLPDQESLSTVRG
jgi:hypothetical protein